jgi:hypothetical protein
MVSFYCFVTITCARRPGAAASAAPACRGGRRASRSDTLAANQAFKRMHILRSDGGLPFHACSSASLFLRMHMCCQRIQILSLVLVLLFFYLQQLAIHAYWQKKHERRKRSSSSCMKVQPQSTLCSHCCDADVMLRCCRLGLIIQPISISVTTASFERMHTHCFGKYL